MNVAERVKLVKAMEMIARNINDELVFDEWLTAGVADGDIKYGDLVIQGCGDDEEVLGYYIQDEEFSDLMATFLHVMKRAWKSGGLYCDNVVSK